MSEKIIKLAIINFTIVFNIIFCLIIRVSIIRLYYLAHFFLHISLLHISLLHISLLIKPFWERGKNVLFYASEKDLMQNSLENGFRVIYRRSYASFINKVIKSFIFYSFSFYYCLNFCKSFCYKQFIAQNKFTMRTWTAACTFNDIIKAMPTAIAKLFP